ncbi:MAG: hypothetical protein CMD98_06590 [Gammaproteobacteria bacterium]|nr:hypothetical protein [Gammaproteobacteria bacterium]|tara:strand:+ start:3153 stop:3380 length:228 start_codon:yes stop_codon:yes gene_type:complete
MTPSKERIDPPHYTVGTIDCITYITDKNLNFLEGNIVKYVTRWRMKNGLEDLHKAKWYLTKLIQEEEKKAYDQSD